MGWKKFENLIRNGKVKALCVCGGAFGKIRKINKEGTVIQDLRVSELNPSRLYSFIAIDGQFWFINRVENPFRMK